MTTLDSEKAYVVKTVSEHLLWLKQNWNLRVTDTVLKLTSNSLRILLVDENFRNAWRYMGLVNRRQLYALDLREEIKNAGNPRFSVALLGGGVADEEGDAEVGVIFFDAYPPPAYTSDPEPAKRLMNINKYSQSPCIIIGDKYLSSES